MAKSRRLKENVESEELPKPAPSNAELVPSSDDDSDLGVGREKYLKYHGEYNERAHEFYTRYEKGKLALFSVGVGIGIWLLKENETNYIVSLLSTLSLFAALAVTRGLFLTSKLEDFKANALTLAFEQQDSNLTKPENGPNANSYLAIQKRNKRLNKFSEYCFWVVTGLLALAFWGLNPLTAWDTIQHFFLTR